MERIKNGTYKVKEVKLEEIKIIRIHKDDSIINIETNPKNNIHDIRSLLNSKYDFSYKLQYHDAFGQILTEGLTLNQYNYKDIYIWWKNNEGQELKNFYKNINVKLSGAIDFVITLNLDVSWTYGKLKNRIQYLTGIFEGKMLVKTGNKLRYDHEYICFSEGLLHDFIQIDIMDKIWLTYKSEDWKFTKYEKIPVKY
jgi:hypothetical protein